METPAINANPVAAAAFNRTAVAGERRKVEDSELERSEAEDTAAANSDGEDQQRYELRAREEEEDQAESNQFGLGRKVNITV